MLFTNHKGPAAGRGSDLEISPYISFVVTTRNDNYGGNLLHRTKVFLNAQLELWKKHGLDAELIIVEWNPPEDQPRFKDALTWPTCLDPETIRIIEVPGQIHRQFPNSDKIPLFEHIGRNVGVRRARGEYVLVTSPEVLYNEDLIKFLTSRRLSPDCFYRADRYDVDATVPLQANVEEQLAFCAKHVSRVDVRGGTITLHRPPVGLGRISLAMQMCLHILNSYRRRNSRIEDRLHTNASGDFLLMLRDHWHALRGFPELPTYGHMDGYLCVMAASAGLHQVVLRSPMRIYHQEHDRAVDWEDPSRSSRPVTSYDLWVQHSKEMLRLKKPMIFNDENWGLGDCNLNENVAK
jgi:hypothetical protein